MFALFATRFIRTTIFQIRRRGAVPYFQLFGVCIALSATAFTQAKKDQVAFNFPGKTDHVRSISGNLLAKYTEIAAPPNSANQYLFSITDAAGNRLAQFNFIRSIEGSWSPFNERLYLNDFLGSTRIDCLVWSRGDKRLTSLTEILLHDPNSDPGEGGGAKPPETPNNSRYELTCDRWLAEDKIAVNLEGDTWAGGQFKYRFVYDLRTRKFNWN